MKWLLELIADAFDDEKFPHGAELFIPSANHIFNADEAAAQLQFEKWQEIPQEVLVRNRDRISYLTEKGFRFLLPAFLTTAIACPKQVDVLVDNVISALTPPEISQEHLYDNFQKRANLLVAAQAKTIYAFFEAYTDIYPEVEWSFNADARKRVDKAIVFWATQT